MSESKPSSHHNATLHIWPRHGDLLSFDVSSIAALLFLQLAIPGRFSLAYCSNSDSSPTGQLPYLTHGLHHVSGFASIAAYVRKLPHARNVDAGLGAVQAAQLTARVAHVESVYGDLVNHTIYSLQENWIGVTRPALVSMLPVPQCYYVPSRIRTLHKPRLEAAELWHVPEVEDEPEEPRKVIGRRKKRHPENETHKFKSAFEREKVVEKTRALLDVYDRLLGSQTYFMGSATPTTLDVIFAAHTHFLLTLKFPDPLVVSVLRDSYPRLVAHSDAVFSTAMPDHSFFPPTEQTAWTSSLRYMIPWPRTPASRKITSPELEKVEWQYKLWRWGFIGASLLAAAAYLNYSTIIIITPRRAANRSAGLPSTPILPEEHEGDVEEDDDDDE